MLGCLNYDGIYVSKKNFYVDESSKVAKNASFDNSDSIFPLNFPLFKAAIPP
jgi:hypothetical protein